MADMFYPVYLLALLIVPLLAKWRWGLGAPLAVSIAEVGLVVLLSHWLIPPSPYPVGSRAETAVSPLVQIRRNHMYGLLMFVDWVMVPAVAALISGVLAAAWWGIQAVWRSVAGQR